MESLHQVRAVALTDYAMVAAGAGLNATAMLDRVGLSSAMLLDPKARLPAYIVARLLEDSAELSGKEAFGIMMAKRRTFESMGAIVPIVQAVPTLRDAIRVT